ncbi:MAG: hypothetical protein O4861_23615, partial [Trichodesmium sp. St16_bin4-tuft]|nr:hypothetical protein [Trichodesmium sp. St18_bin3_1_1]MDE5101157.1 hypothetical protein [Trichodesmium sp. St16_bin4-tuft]MDE5105168.1 hypothetical protein [Trichodesmium sp. St19_bin2]
VSQNQSIFHSRLYSLNPYPTMLLSGLSPREELERLNYLSHTLLTHYRVFLPLNTKMLDIIIRHCSGVNNPQHLKTG